MSLDPPPADGRPFAAAAVLAAAVSPLASRAGCFGEAGQAAEGARVPKRSTWFWPGESFEVACAFVAFAPVEGRRRRPPRGKRGA